MEVVGPSERLFKTIGVGHAELSDNLHRRGRIAISGAVVADGFDRATFHGFLAQLFLFGRTRLLIDVGIAAVIISAEIAGGGFAAEIAVDALVIDIIFAGNIFGIAVCDISHNFFRSINIYGTATGAMFFLLFLRRRGKVALLRFRSADGGILLSLP
jgi:hypothetical protein